MTGVIVSMTGFTLIAVALLVTELLARRRGARSDQVPPDPNRTIGFRELIRGIAALPGGRAVLLASWCWVGWHLLAR